MKLIENLLNASYNLQKVDWKDFDEHLQKTKDKMIVKMQRITSLKAISDETHLYAMLTTNLLSSYSRV